MQQQNIITHDAIEDANKIYTMNKYAKIPSSNEFVTHAQSIGPANLPSHGFGQFEIPEMPAYVSRYTKRGGGAFIGQNNTGMQQTRFGNPRYIGGMDGYVSELESNNYFESLKQKKGNHGVFDFTRWNPGFNSEGNIAGASALKNYAGIQTRGGRLRAGAPKRADYAERINYEMNIRPGIGVSRHPQAGGGENFAGIRAHTKKTPQIQQMNDMVDLRQMIEYNPFHISSHSAKLAKDSYDHELQNFNIETYKSYPDHLNGTQQQKNIKIVEPYWGQAIPNQL